jgi:acyl-CoA synthetase (AMP-forming)/AMP-acid ligase II
MHPSAASTTDLTVTQRLIGAAAGYGSRLALAARRAGAPYSYAELAATIQRAAAGLAWRGLRPGDVVGIYVPDAVCHVLACHAISAAGGVPCPVAAQLGSTEVAERLARCGARMLLTAQPLAKAALAAADRSWVRQVISFDEAPATTPFSTLLGMGSLSLPGRRAHDLAMIAFRRHDDGTLTAAEMTHRDMAAEIARVATVADITGHDVVLAAPPAGDGCSYTTYLHYALLQGATVIAAEADDLSGQAGPEVTAAIIPSGLEFTVGSIRVLPVPA